MKRKTYLYIGLALIAAYFIKKEIEKNAVNKFVASSQDKNLDCTKKIDEIKSNVFELIEKFHFTYKSDVMTNEEIDNYENIINNYIVKT